MSARLRIIIYSIADELKTASIAGYRVSLPTGERQAEPSILVQGDDLNQIEKKMKTMTD
jgi:hypothetical protein